MGHMNAIDTETVGKARAGTAVRKRGKARVSDILEAAKNILVQHGLANLTTRSVANELGISVGNLAYYFPSKDALLQAIVEHVIDGYDREVRQEFETFPDNPKERLQAFFRYMIDDAKKPDVQGFFYQFWGFATHDPKTATARTEMYRHFSAQVRGLIQDVHPDLDLSELENMAFGLLAFIEGLHVVFGSGNIRHIHSRTFEEYMYQQMLRMTHLDT